MKVYELIQELTNFDADCEVEINVILDKVEIETEDKYGNEVTVKVDFDDNNDFDVTSKKSYYGNRKDTVVLEANF